MVLSLKAWKSRSLPGLPRTLLLLNTMIDFKTAASDGGRFVLKNGYRARIFGSLKRIIVVRARIGIGLLLGGLSQIKARVRAQRDFPLEVGIGN